MNPRILEERRQTMTKQISGEHIQREELINYFDGSFAEDNGRARRLEEHLAECDDCVEKAKEIRKSASAYLRWTAKSHGEAYLQSVMAKALEEVSSKEKSWSARLGQWKKQGAVLKENALRVVMASAKKAGRILSEQVEATLTLPLSPVRVLGATRAVRLRGGAAAQKQKVEPKAHVKIEGAVVHVWVENVPPSRESILVMLIPLDEGKGKRSFIRELTRDKKNILTAEFREKDLSGDYLVAFEPL
jgi:anti-sigma factor RsiW